MVAISTFVLRNTTLFFMMDVAAESFIESKPYHHRFCAKVSIFVSEITLRGLKVKYLV